MRILQKKPLLPVEYQCKICKVMVKNCSRKAHMNTKMHQRCLIYTEEKERLLNELGRGKKFSTDLLEKMQNGESD